MILANERYDAMIRSYLDGQCSQDEALALLSWIAESEENREYFESFKDVWSLTAFSFDDDAVDVEAALELVNEKIEAAEVETKTVEMPWIRRHYKYVSGIAAAFIVALFIGFLVRNPFNPTVTYAYNIENESTYILPDGTLVNFDDEGTLSHPKHFAASERSVDFEGVAFFAVTKAETQPFVIHCNKMDVEVLGTSFQLNAEKNAERYTLDLYSGKVKMTAFDKKGNTLSQVEVNPGERGVLDVVEGELKTMTYAEVKEEELKTDHVLDFNNVSLNTIVQTVEFIYGVEVELPDAYADEKVTMRFSDKDSVDEVVETIATLFDLEVSKNEKTYTIH